MADIRKGDVYDLLGGKAEVLSVVANNEGGVDLVLRYADVAELSRTVLRRGGPDEREEDKLTHVEDYEDEVDDVDDVLDEDEE